jgi:peroxiredoxin
MLLLSRSWIIVTTIGLAVACTACQSKNAEKPAARKPAAAAAKPRPSEPSGEEPAVKPVAKVEPKPAAPMPKPQAPPPPPTIPKVALSNALRATCVVNVGDTMPEAELPDPAGKMHALDSLYGQKLTVVCFWTIGSTRRSRLEAAAVLRDLTRDVAAPFRQKGVQVVGINVGDAAMAVKQEVDQTGVTFPRLLDPKGEFLAKVAKDKQMPRVFLLDAGGRILWFDVELDRFSRYDLVQSIRAVVGEL